MTFREREWDQGNLTNCIKSRRQQIGSVDLLTNAAWCSFLWIPKTQNDCRFHIFPLRLPAGKYLIKFAMSLFPFIIIIITFKYSFDLYIFNFYCFSLYNFRKLILFLVILKDYPVVFCNILTKFFNKNLWLYFKQFWLLQLSYCWVVGALLLLLLLTHTMEFFFIFFYLTKYMF